MQGKTVRAALGRPVTYSPGGFKCIRGGLVSSERILQVCPRVESYQVDDEKTGKTGLRSSVHSLNQESKGHREHGSWSVWSGTHFSPGCPDDEMCTIKTMPRTYGPAHSDLGEGRCPREVVNATERELDLEGEPDLKLFPMSQESCL